VKFQSHYNTTRPIPLLFFIDKLAWLDSLGCIKHMQNQFVAISVPQCKVIIYENSFLEKRMVL